MTEILNSLVQINQFKDKNQRKKIAFVPTMGNLHDGHLSLVHKAKQNADKVMVSIFVNPTQFGENEDLGSYPRTFDADLAKLKAVGVNALFFPTEELVYPYGAGDTLQIHLPKTLTNQLCGLIRPAHFQGVATVVAKLLQLVKPDIAIFGEKDYQQLMVIKRLCKELFINTKIIGSEIIREKNGLAMSSRNQYLTAQEKQKASGIYKSLQQAKLEIVQGKTVPEAINDSLIRLEQQGIAVEYFECRNKANLLPCSDKENALLLVAAKIGSARLIDNLSL